MKANPKTLAKGLATFVPGVNRFLGRRPGGSVSARYCYSVWLRHLLRISVCSPRPILDTIAELGPGDSLGLGLAAILSGAKTYFAFDVQPHARPPINLAVFDELVSLFGKRSAIPDAAEFPRILPNLSDHSFPDHLLSPSLLDLSLSAPRLEMIRSALMESRTSGPIRYKAPWFAASERIPGTVDFAFSQAVMEHVDHPEEAYEALHCWLAPGGLMAHSIDYASHGYAKDWYGHWTVADFTWRLLRGGRPYLINRFPHSAHIAAIRRAGFEIEIDERIEDSP
jgi:hypothetical protein